MPQYVTRQPVIHADGTVEDPLGHRYGPGSVVAIAIVNNKSPQMVLARVERINLNDSKGRPHVAYWLPPLAPGQVDRYDQRPRSSAPGFTVAATPLLDSRGFYRGPDERSVTYLLTENILAQPHLDVQAVLAAAGPH